MGNDWWSESLKIKLIKGLGRRVNTLEMNRKLQYTEHNLKSRAHIIPNLQLVSGLLLLSMYFVCTEIGQHTAKWKFNELCKN